MKLFRKTLIISITLSAFLSLSIQAVPSYATTQPDSNTTQSTCSSEFAKVVKTTFFGDVEDDGEGCSIYIVTNLILDIITSATGILAVVGLSIVGIQYLTAKGNEQQTTKAKQRILEIVIGVVAYAVLYAALNFFLPGGKLNPSEKCSPSSSQSSSSQESELTKPGDGSQKPTDAETK